jgi:hypothetical protein
MKRRSCVLPRVRKSNGAIVVKLDGSQVVEAKKEKNMPKPKTNSIPFGQNIHAARL